MGRTSCSRPAGADRRVGGTPRRGTAARELILDRRVHLFEPEVEGIDPGGADLPREWAPEVAAVEGPLDARDERVDSLGVLGVASAFGVHQPLERVLKVPLAEVDLGLGPEALQRRRWP